MVSGTQLASWLSRLVRIPSVNPAHAGPKAGVPGEGQLASRLAEWFENFGGEVYIDTVLNNRPNICGIWQGNSARWFAVDAHMDTVSVEHMTGDPFSGEIKNERVFGRGSVDTKATLGVVLCLLQEMHRLGIKPAANLLIAGTIDEEVGALGAPAFAKWVRNKNITIDQLIVAEPTMCSPVYAHKSTGRLEICVEGKSSHASQPQLGKNAIVAAASLISTLEEEHKHLQSSTYKIEVGPPSLTVTQINGGRGLNVVPDICTISIDRRLVPGEKASDVVNGIIQLVKRKCPLPVKTKVLQEIDPFYQSPDTPFIRQLAGWSGNTPAVIPFGTNTFAYDGLAKEIVVLGPGSIDQAHSEEEWVSLTQLRMLADIYQKWWEVSL